MSFLLELHPGFVHKQLHRPDLVAVHDETPHPVTGPALARFADLRPARRPTEGLFERRDPKFEFLNPAPQIVVGAAELRHVTHCD
jgi:hypothetical protein